MQRFVEFREVLQVPEQVLRRIVKLVQHPWHREDVREHVGLMLARAQFHLIRMQPELGIPHEACGLVIFEQRVPCICTQHHIRNIGLHPEVAGKPNNGGQEHSEVSGLRFHRNGMDHGMQLVNKPSPPHTQARGNRCVVLKRIAHQRARLFALSLGKGPREVRVSACALAVVQTVNRLGYTCQFAVGNACPLNDFPVVVLRRGVAQKEPRHLVALGGMKGSHV
eukprot:5079427-Alexandrium_andersonii.AAC.1